MKIQVIASSKKGITLDVNYNRMIQAMIYNNISNEELHDKGHRINGRDFKLFTFSQIVGKNKFDKKDRTITFEDEIRFIVSSADTQLISDLLNNLLTRDIKLGDNDINILEINHIDETIKTQKILVEAVSPVVAYSTEVRNNSKYTRYFSPDEREFIRIVEENLQKKHKIVTNSNEKIKVTNLEDNKKIVTKYKGTIIEAYYGTFLLEGCPEILQTALSCGIGSKSSQGFGCIELRGEFYVRSDS